MRWPIFICKKKKSIVVKLEYKAKIPAARITSKNLEQFENILLKNCKIPKSRFSPEVSISFGNFSEESNTIKRFLNDPTFPKEIRDFSWRIYCEEGEIWLRADSFGAKVTISGTKEWVTNKKQDIHAFLKNHEKLSRRIFNYPPLAFVFFIVGCILFSLFLSLFKTGFQPKLMLLLIGGLFLIIFSGVQLFAERRKFIPHLTIELQEIEKSEWKGNLIITIVAGIIIAVILGLMFG